MRQQLRWYRVAMAAKRAGIAHCCVHDLRHTYGSMLIAAGADVTYVQRQMGHSDPTVTLKRYAGLWDEELNARKVTAFLGDRFGGQR
jgi:integrase